MNFLLVPFLLVIRVPSNGKWNRGPEYTFEVHIDSMPTVQRRGDEVLWQPERNKSQLICKLLCRPKQPSSLICHVEWPKPELIPMPNNVSAEQMGSQEDIIRAYSVPFEIRFNEQGIESYLFQNDGHPAMLFLMDMYRAIANQLSIGSNLAGKPNSFRAAENFTTGTCPTDFDILRGYGAERREAFMLTYLIDVGIRYNEAISITKWRDMKNCSPRHDYLLGTKHQDGIEFDPDVPETIDISVTQVLISKFKFFSETANTFGLYNQKTNITESILEEISIFLKSVQPAKGRLPKIKNGIIKDVMVGPIIRRDLLPSLPPLV